MNQNSAALNACSAEIKQWMMRQPDVRVETLTAWVLENLAAKSNAITYKKLSPATPDQDAVADWEWWFILSDTSSFAARVLARKLEAATDNYDQIANTNNGKLHIEQQLAESAKDGYATFFVLYATNDDNASICKNDKSKDGIFHGEANRFRKEFILKGRRILQPSDILAIANPVSCAFGCPGIYGEGMDKEAGFRQHIGHYFPMRADNLRDRTHFQELGFSDTPEYIRELIDNKATMADWETKYRDKLNGSKAIVVVDLRD